MWGSKKDKHQDKILDALLEQNALLRRLLDSPARATGALLPPLPINSTGLTKRTEKDVTVLTRDRVLEQQMKQTGVPLPEHVANPQPLDETAPISTDKAVTGGFSPIPGPSKPTGETTPPSSTPSPDGPTESLPS